MAKNISLLGADYPGVPAVQLPQTGGGTATFYDVDYKGHYFITPLSFEQTNGLYFGVTNFRSMAPDTNYTVTLLDAQGGITLDPADFTITKYTYGIRMFTSKQKYDGLIPAVTIS